MKTCRVELGSLTAGVVMNEQNVITRAAPSFRWSVGKDIQVLTSWVNKKKGQFIVRVVS